MQALVDRLSALRSVRFGVAGHDRAIPRGAGVVARGDPGAARNLRTLSGSGVDEASARRARGADHGRGDLVPGGGARLEAYARAALTRTVRRVETVGWARRGRAGSGGLTL